MSELPKDKLIKVDEFTAEELLKQLYRDVAYIREKVGAIRDENGELESRIKTLEANDIKRSAQQKAYITIGGVILTVINVGANLAFKFISSM